MVIALQFMYGYLIHNSHLYQFALLLYNYYYTTPPSRAIIIVMKLLLIYCIMGTSVA